QPRRSPTPPARHRPAGPRPGGGRGGGAGRLGGVTTGDPRDRGAAARPAVSGTGAAPARPPVVPGDSIAGPPLLAGPPGRPRWSLVDQLGRGGRHRAAGGPPRPRVVVGRPRRPGGGRERLVVARRPAAVDQRPPGR